MMKTCAEDVLGEHWTCNRCCERMQSTVMPRRSENAPCHRGMCRQVPRLWVRHMAVLLVRADR
ncbi:UNVERIFIED_CONTAM: hypothetical protein Sangu_1872200 [Sesamum angustifolium]|uniref:Uncharacterized protein n=1 Tax=Sesamum angustifolium TaxID=2727405 RepID=A0AAW2LTU9_9LAMI